MRDMEDAIREADARATQAQNSLAQQKGDLDQKLRERDDEVENIKWVNIRFYIYIFQTLYK